MHTKSKRATTGKEHGLNGFQRMTRTRFRAPQAFPPLSNRRWTGWREIACGASHPLNPLKSVSSVLRHAADPSEVHQIRLTISICAHLRHLRIK
jgi:hypothetical protein